MIGHRPVSWTEASSAPPSQMETVERRWRVSVSEGTISITSSRQLHSGGEDGTNNEPLLTFGESLPDDVLLVVLASLSASQLVACSRVSTKFSVLSRQVARQRTATNFPTEGVGSLRRLRAMELLEDRVGPQPTSLDRWRDDWSELIKEECILRGYSSAAALGPVRSIEVLAQALQLPISWLEDAGWPSHFAMPCSLLGFCGRAALGRAMKDSDSAYSASQWLCSTALFHQALRLKEPAPPAYRNLSGNGGLQTDDPCWHLLKSLSSPATLLKQRVSAALRAQRNAAAAAGGSSGGDGTRATRIRAAPPPPAQLSFETSSVVLTDTNPECFQSEDGFSVLTWAPAEGGGSAILDYQLQPMSDVVCFLVRRACVKNGRRSAAFDAISPTSAAPLHSLLLSTPLCSSLLPSLDMHDSLVLDPSLLVVIFCILGWQSQPTDGHGFHSLIPSGGTTYSMPPLARVTLLSVQQPGTWQVGGRWIKQKLFTVTLTYL